MSRTPSLEPTIRAAVQQFTSRVAALVETVTVQRIQSAILENLGAPLRRGPGRPPKNPLGLMPAGASLFAGLSSAKKRPKQLCPVPGCKNPAAPVFGMVCAEHKNVSRAKIKEYREARRQAQKTAAGKASTRGRGRPRATAGSRSAGKTATGRRPASARKTARGAGKGRRRAPARSLASGTRRGQGGKAGAGATATTTASRAPAPAHAANGTLPTTPAAS